MPFFHRKSEEEKRQEEAQKQREAEASAERDASLTALVHGGIPLPAQRRLDQVRQGNEAFTSDLSVNEFLLAREVGLQPITQVMGSSMYHVGWQNINWTYFSGEMEVISAAFTNARRLALGRMAQEAERAGANVVVGVRIESMRPEYGASMIEYQAFGTAARLEGAPQTKHVALTNLSGQDFWKLYAAGFWPLGVAAGSTVFHAVNTWRQQMSAGFFSSWANQELPDFTQSMYHARSIALGRVQQEAMSQHGAQGIVGVSMEQEEEEIEVQLGNDQERTDMLFTFHIIGTCVGQLETTRTPKIQTAVLLKP